MAKLVKCLVFLFGISPLCIQAQIKLQHNSIISGTADIEIYATALSADHHICITGALNGTADFDPGPGVSSLSAAGGKDIFIAVYDTTGGLLWAKKFGNNVDQYGNLLAVSSRNELLVGGQFSGMIDFDPGPGMFNISASGDPNFFLAKYSSNGSLIWVKQIDGVMGMGMQLNSQDQVFLAGHFSGAVDFDPGTANGSLISNGFTDVFIARYDTAGDYLWANHIGAGSTEYLSDLKLDNHDNIYLSGVTGAAGSIDCDPGAATANLTVTGPSAFFASYQGNGTYRWAFAQDKNFSFKNVILLNRSTATMYILGVYGNPGIDFDPGPAVVNLPAKSRDVYIAAFDLNMNFRWIKRLSGPMDDAMNSASIDANGNIYSLGEFYTRIDMDPGSDSSFMIATPFQKGYYMSCLDSNGNYVWGLGIDSASQLTTWPAPVIDPQGNIYLSGYFSNTIDLDFNWTIDRQTAQGIRQGFISRYRPCQPTVFSGLASTQNGCAGHPLSLGVQPGTLISYQWIKDLNTVVGGNSPTLTFNSLQLSDSGAYRVVALSACNAVVSGICRVRVNQVDTGVTVSGMTLNAQAAGASYQWIYCNTLSPVNGATSQSFTAFSNGFYAVVITQNGCTDTSACYLVMVGSSGIAIGQGKLKVYPNPAAELLHVQTEEEILSLQVFDLGGRLLFQEEHLNTASVDLPVQKLLPGYYLLSAVTRSGLLLQGRFVKL